ncbi:MAG: histidine--tRNA ligase [Actinomycetota bacterium]
MAQASFRSPKGTRDILPGEAERQRAVVNAFADQARMAGFGHVITPIFEDLGVFKRLGESTDVVTKEMYDFVAKDGKHYALRPELTAAVVRAFVQHRPAMPWKVWYEGPQFRYERPQAGRYRQFSQIGVEAIGTEDPAIDAEIIALGWRFYESLGLRQVTLLLNSLGDPTCRPAYLEALTSYFRARHGELSEQSQHTLEVNPLRVLDSKRPEDQAIIDDAPVMVDHLSPETAEHFDGVRRILDRLEIPHEISPRLVRGLDYYTRTTFEFAGHALEGSQNALGGGGRYDALSSDLGGPDAPGIGFALGVDRILLECDAEGVFPAADALADVFIIDTTGGDEASVLQRHLATAGIASDRAYDARSMKAQFKAADRSGARVALIVGDDERAAESVTIRPLQGENRDQTTVPVTALIDNLSTHLS